MGQDLRLCMVEYSVCGNTMCLSLLSVSEVQGSEKNLFRATCLVSWLLLSEIMVQGEPVSGNSFLNYTEQQKKRDFKSST